MKKIFSVCTLVLLVLNQVVVAVDPRVEEMLEGSTAVNSGYIYGLNPLVQKWENLSLAKKCEAIEGIQELKKQEKELPTEYRFIPLDDGYEVLQEQCNEKIEEMLTFYGEVASDETVPSSGDELFLPENEEESISDEALTEDENTENEDEEETEASLPLEEKAEEEMTELEPLSDFEIIQPLIAVTSGNVSIDIPDYDSLAGWEVGPSGIKEAIITANFGSTGTDKRIRIAVSEGMRFIMYPVLTVTNSSLETVANTELSSVLDSVTSKPQRQLYYPSYNRGYLEYKLKTTATQAEIRVSFTVDEYAYYGSTGVITNAINLKAITDGVENQLSLDVTQTGPLLTYNLWSMNGWFTPQILQGGTGAAPNIGLYRTVRNNNVNSFVKTAKVFYYYPKELTVQSVTFDGVTNYTIDPDVGLVTFTRDNLYHNFSYNQLILSASGVAPGIYTASNRVTREVETYDGRILTGVVSYAQYVPLQVRVLAPDEVNDTLTVGKKDSVYVSLTPNYYNSQSFHIQNLSPLPKKSQVMEYSIGSGYEAIQITFPITPTTSQKPTTIDYKTSAGNTGIATSSQIVMGNTGLNQVGYSISTTSLGLAPGEYLTYAKAYIGDVDITDLTPDERYAARLTSTAFIVGRLSDGVNAATVTMTTRSQLGDGTPKAGTQSTITANVTRMATPKFAANITPLQGTTFSATAGGTKTIGIRIEPFSYVDRAPIGGFTNPVIFIRKPSGGILFPTNTIRAVQGGQDIPVDINEYVTSQGVEVLAITAQTNVGRYFGEKQKPSVDMYFDIALGTTAAGSINWHDYVLAATTPLYDYDFGSPGVLQPIADVYDVNNNGSTGDTLWRLNTSTMSIISNKALNIDTYILPNGGIRQPEYNTSNPSSAIGFTPSSRGDYTVELFNNRDDVVTKIETYLPVPRVGNNFGSEFQSTGFSRNMKLGNAPVIKVYNKVGADITTTASGNYQILYTTQATNGSNYQGATYTSSRANATMIKVLNTAGIQPGEKAVITFDYVVDEDTTSVTANPGKIGSVNDFRPYYYFEAGSIGWQNGTRVGASLHIGEIRGRVFTDMDGDGVFSGVDSPLANAPVSLYLFSGVNYQLKTTTTTTSTGAYTFSDLGNGNYKVDFNTVKINTQYFTKKGNNADLTKNSVVEYLGASSGTVINIDPTTESSKRVNAGVVGGYTSGTLGVTLTGVTTLTITSTGTNPTANLIANITPTFFENIKATTDSMLRTSSNVGVVSVSSNGQIEGKQAGTGKITLTIKDQYGNIAQTTKDIVVLNRIPLTCTTTYAPSTNTNQNVIATLTGCNKPITVTNNGGNTNYTFTNTGSFTFTYQDSYGNTGSTTATVDRIDKTPPTATNVSYNPSGKTNKDVLVTLTTSEQVQAITGRTGGPTVWEKTYNANVTDTVTFYDLVGNSGSTGININWVDKSAVTGTIIYNPSIATSGNVQASISFNKTGVNVTNNNASTNYTFTSDGNFTFTYQDSYGNTGTTTATVDWIDKTPPTATNISYNPSGKTNKDVLVTLITSEQVQVITGRTGGPTVRNKTYSTNATDTVTFYDLVGNNGSTGININRVDKSAVTGTITYNPNTATSGNVQAEISFNKTGVTVIGGVSSLSGEVARSAGGVIATFTGNTSFTFTYQDDYGNTGATTATVNRIDKIPPVATNISYAPSTNTNTDVGVTLTISEPVHRPTDRNGNTTGTVFTKTYTANATGTVTFYDLVGNSGSTGININRIDKSPVVGSIAYSPSTATSGDVQASITFNKPNVTITNANSAPCQGGTGEVIGGTCTFTGNGSFTFTYIDNYGNTGATTATVNWIDKIPPRVVDLQYSPRTTTRGTVEVTITLSESGTIITNGRIPTDCVGTFHQNVLSGETTAICWQKSFAINVNETVIFYDLVGNKSTAPVSITQIVTGGGGGGGGGKTGGEGGDSGTGDTPIGEESNDGNNTSDEEISHIDDKGSSSVENNENTHGTSEISTPDNEIEFSYTRAYQYDITTQSSLEEANPNGVLIRSHLAKMIVNYLANALDRQPDLTKDCSAFEASIQNETAEMQKYMKLACQYGIMGIHTDGTALSDFMSRKTVSRAEFGTVLSRILWGDMYNDAKPYYVKHLQALKNSGIMTQVDNPEKRLELRKWVWLMLMRSVEGEKPASQVDNASIVPTVNDISTISTVIENPKVVSASGNGSNTPLTRGYLAKMVVDYAVNTLGKTLPEKIPTGCYRKDGSKAWESAEMKDYAVKACKLGLMGRNMEYFQPYTKITQEQLAIILYRLLYDSTYVGKKEPRKMPLETLIADGVLESVTNPKAYVVSEELVASILAKDKLTTPS